MITNKKNLIVLSAIVGILLVGAVNCSEGNSETTDRLEVVQEKVEQEAANKAYNFELKDLDGKTHKLSDFRGKVVILDFWDTWCPPCRQEIPGFVALHDEYKDKGFVMIGVAFAQYGPDAVREFMKEYEVEYINLIADQKVIEGFGGITSIPTTFVIDQEGNIVKKHVGFKPKSTFEKEIRELLE